MTEKIKHSRLFLWFIQVLRVCGRELLLVFRDEGVVIFFLLLNAVYPVLYALIYNPEVVRNEAVVVVDDNRTAMSRDLVRRMDATQEVAIVGYAANMQEAQEAMHSKACYGILYVPRDFSQSITHGDQGHVSLYCDMSVMMRYKAMFTALTNVTQAMGGERLAAVVEPVLNMGGSIIENRQVPVGNPAMGIASAVLLFILPLVLQQSMILGIAMLHGGSIERRRRNGGRDPMAVEACVSATIIGKMMCHQIVYTVPVIYVLHYVPLMFGFPQYGNFLHIICLAVPFVIAVSLMGQTLQAFVNERESVFLLFVFSSVVFVFLTGASWPRYLMSRLLSGREIRQPPPLPQLDRRQRGQSQGPHPHRPRQERRRLNFLRKIPVPSVTPPFCWKNGQICANNCWKNGQKDLTLRWKNGREYA